MLEDISQIIGAPLFRKEGVFGTDGIRGKAGNPLSPILALQAGYWFGQVIQNKAPVLIGMDSRTSGAMLSSALKAGLTAAGHDVWDIGLCPTPAIPKLINSQKLAGGLMVSASHNPPEDNGIKFFNSSGKKLEATQQRIIESGLRGTAIEPKSIESKCFYGNVAHREDLLRKYIDQLLGSVEKTRLDDVHIVLDLCWGAATACAKEIFEELGAELTLLHENPDGTRINVGCGSTKLSPLQQSVTQNRAAMGFAFDGDADRVIAVDNKGRVIDGDHVLFLWGSELKEQKSLPQQMLVTTVMSNLGFEKAWLAKGGLLTRTAVGDQNVHSAMLSSGAALGGEQSGHILSAAHGLFGDGLLTALQLATICIRKKITLSEWLDESFQPFPQKLINVPFENSDFSANWQECRPLKEAILKAEKEIGKEGRVLVRESGTEPLIRVLVEASDVKTVEKWSHHLANVAKKNLNIA